MVIDTHKNRDIMTADVPNSSIPAEMPPKLKVKDRVVMKVTGN